jgi:hypothetical protein
MDGSFDLFVGKRAVVLLVGSPATCGLFAWTSVDDVAKATAVRIKVTTAAAKASSLKRFI